MDLDHAACPWLSRLHRKNRFYGDLDAALVFFNQLSWIPLMLAAWIFLPEFYAKGVWTTGQTHLQGQSYGADFILTRAVDRTCVFRARGVLFGALLVSRLRAGLPRQYSKPGSHWNFPAAPAQYKMPIIISTPAGQLCPEDGAKWRRHHQCPLAISAQAAYGGHAFFISTVWLILLPLLSRLRHPRLVYWDCSWGAFGLAFFTLGSSR